LKRTVAALIVAAVCGFPGMVLSCNVPVFRYALERWPADLYEVFVFHRGELAPGERAVTEWLEESGGAGASAANCTVRVVDLSSGTSEALMELWKTVEYRDLPCLAVRYPGLFGYRLTFWSAGLTMENAAAILDSPARREIAGRLLEGESAVWVFLESGDGEKDAAAAETLGECLSRMEETLRLPGAVEGNESFSPVDVSNGPELRIEFSIVRVSRKDPAETAFVEMLMHTEPDLFEYASHPMAFPVFGRGRALYALIGGGINERNIRAACEFITGACSCEVKAMNPGVDLLMAVDWDSEIKDAWVGDAILPPLVGISEMVRAAGNDASPATAPADSAVSPEAPTPVEAAGEAGEKERSVEDAALPVSEPVGTPGSLARNILVTLGVVLSVVFVLSYVTIFRKPRNRV